MTNNKIDFYVVKLSNYSYEDFTIVYTDNNTKTNGYASAQIVCVKESMEDDTMTEIFTGKKIAASTAEVENILTYNSRRPATANDLHGVAFLVNMQKRGCTISDEIAKILEEAEELAQKKYKNYMDELDSITDFYVNNMIKINRK